jgi:peptide/nickel transport system ATP-binding protein
MSDRSSTKPPVLVIERLRVGFDVGGHIVQAVADASITVPDGGAVGLVGESGSGKSTLARSVLGLHSAPPKVLQAQRFEVGGKAVDPADTKAMRGLRGGTAAMVFQDPLTYLNPLQRVGTQVSESLALHDPKANSGRRVAELLDLVKLPERVARSYPHELSGGMRQRAMLAIALGCRPRLLVADEPTTALDVTTQAEILQLIKALRQELQMGLLMISHDLGAIAEVCDEVYVMYGGKTIERGPRAALFESPLHPYTQNLLRAAQAARDEHGRFVTLDPELGKAFKDHLPAGEMFVHAETAKPDAGAWSWPTRPTATTPGTPGTPGTRQTLAMQSPEARSTPAAAAAPPLIEVRHVDQTFVQQDGRLVHAVRDVSLVVGAGETVALVGESGSGKSSLARLILCLSRPVRGEVLFDGERVDQLSNAQLLERRKLIQPVFQDSAAAFNPRRTVFQLLRQALLQGPYRAANLETMAATLLEQVHLAPGRGFFNRLPHELSGGQRQRLSIARALAMRPRVIVADEPLSGADISIRGQILNLLVDLQAEYGMSYLFITHDMAVAREFAHRVLVMYHGQIVEQGLAHEVFDAPQHPYTRTLVDSSLAIFAQPADRALAATGVQQQQQHPMPLPIAAQGCASRKAISTTFIPTAARQ